MHLGVMARVFRSNFSLTFAIWMTLSLCSTPLFVPRSSMECAVPNWTVNEINITYSDDTYTPGTASFVLSNSLTNKTDSLTCPLTFNSLCQILGTPNDETLQVLLQVNIDVAFMTLNQSWTCHDQTNQTLTSTFVIGTGTLDLDCPFNPDYTEATKCNGPVDGTGLINGTMVVPETVSG